MELWGLELLRATSVIGLAISATKTACCFYEASYHYKNNTVRDIDIWRGQEMSRTYEYPFALSKAKKSGVITGLFLLGSLCVNYFVNDMKDTQMRCVDIKKMPTDVDCFLLDTDNNPKTIEYIAYSPNSLDNMTKRQNLGGVKVGTSMTRDKWTTFTFCRALTRINQ